MDFRSELLLATDRQEAARVQYKAARAAMMKEIRDLGTHLRKTFVASGNWLVAKHAYNGNSPTADGVYILTTLPASNLVALEREISDRGWTISVSTDKYFDGNTNRDCCFIQAY